MVEMVEFNQFLRFSCPSVGRKPETNEVTLLVHRISQFVSEMTSLKQNSLSPATDLKYLESTLYRMSSSRKIVQLKSFKKLRKNRK